MRLAVTGSREWTDEMRLPLDQILTRTHESRGIELLIHGGAVGLDMMAGKWARERGIAVCEFPYAGFYGTRGGSIRNGWMIEFGRPELVLAFPLPESRGTWDMVTQSRNGRIEVLILYPGEDVMRP